MNNSTNFPIRYPCFRLMVPFELNRILSLLHAPPVALLGITSNLGRLI